MRVLAWLLYATAVLTIVFGVVGWDWLMYTCAGVVVLVFVVWWIAARRGEQIDR